MKSLSLFLPFFVFIGVACWSPRGIAHSKRSINSVTSLKEFSVCTHELPPHSMPDGAGNPSGMATGILLAVADKLHWKLNITYYPWMRARMNAEMGKCDLIYTILKKEEYERFAVFPKEGLETRYNVLITRAESNIEFAGDLEGFMRRFSVGTYQDKVVSPLFDKFKREPWARVEYTVGAENNLKKLLGGRIDAIAENKATAIYELKKMGQLPLVKIHSPALSVSQAFIAFSKKGRALEEIEAFEGALKAFKASPEYRNVLDSY